MDKAKSSPSQSADTQPPLGDPTARLSTGARKVNLERGDATRSQASTESFYAETQRRVAQLDDPDVMQHWQAARESSVSPAHTPSSYRDAVKRYFLSRHAGEEQ